MEENDQWIKVSICSCCLVICANGDHSGCEGNCTNTECDDKCDHGCAATFEYARSENAGYRLTASYVGCGSDHDGGCACGEGYFSWSPCEWCGNIAGQRVDVWAEIIKQKESR